MLITWSVSRGVFRGHPREDISNISHHWSTVSSSSKLILTFVKVVKFQTFCIPVHIRLIVLELVEQLSLATPSCFVSVLFLEFLFEMKEGRKTKNDRIQLHIKIRYEWNWWNPKQILGHMVSMVSGCAYQPRSLGPLNFVSVCENQTLIIGNCYMLTIFDTTLQWKNFIIIMIIWMLLESFLFEFQRPRFSACI